MICIGRSHLSSIIFYWPKASSCQWSYSECDKSFADLIQQFSIVVLLFASFLGLWIKHVLVPFVRRNLRSGIRTSLAFTWQPTISRDYCSGNDSRCVPYVPIWAVKRAPRSHAVQIKCDAVQQNRCILLRFFFPPAYRKRGQITYKFFSDFFTVQICRSNPLSRPLHVGRVAI